MSKSIALMGSVPDLAGLSPGAMRTRATASFWLPVAKHRSTR